MPRRSKHRIQCQFYEWNLFKRKGVFYADGRSASEDLGKHSLGTRDEDQAMQRLRELDHHMAHQHGLTDAPSSSLDEQLLTIRDGWKKHEKRCNRSTMAGGVCTSTKKRYRSVHVKHLAFCKLKSIRYWQQVDRKHCLAYVEWLKARHYADNSAYLEGTVLSQIVKWLIEDEHRLPQSQRFKLSLRRSHETDAYCYALEEVAAILNHCCACRELDWLTPLITLLATTGMRIGEAAGLRWSDVDLVNDMITLTDNRHSGRAQRLATVRTTKGRRSRRIPIHPDLKTVLIQLPHHPDGQLFHGPRGGRLKPDTARRCFVSEVIKPLTRQFPTPRGEIGFEHARFHSFRHYFVSQAFLCDASEGEIREWVGHSDSRIVERYRHLRDKDAQMKMQRLQLINTNATQQRKAE